MRRNLPATGKRVKVPLRRRIIHLPDNGMDGAATGAQGSRVEDSRIRAWRKHRGLTLAKLGDRVGFSISNIRRFELGTQAVLPSDLARAAKALDCDISAFFLPFDPDDPGHRIVAVIKKMTRAERENLLSVIELLIRQRAA